MTRLCLERKTVNIQARLTAAAALDTYCMCTVFTKMHVYLAAGSAASRSAFCSSGKQQSTARRYRAHNSVTLPFQMNCLDFKMSFFFMSLFSLLICVSSFTYTDPLCYPALFADHIATPMKLAVTAFAPCLLQDVVASSTAQTLTVVHAGTGLVADSTLRAS